ncbi:hypothetical protein BA768_18950 [Chryseobacterium sp. CBo1]|uniref:hypothetical protein n=1 Tax=Chryseobacterium sp. CBo1 TaxID=1869230 RepID=UPI0008107A17|nr:hypothetical protein [Chryseobacterium sp. CBo1]OCK50795.1 hypothetical protein BA768_18950 [Chryseobacterium sp. CBo1]
MRIQIDFDKKVRSQTVLALERFLNYNLIEINHGLTFEAIFITFIEKPKKTQKFKRKFLYKKYADISIPLDFSNYSELNLVDFNNAFESIIENIEVVNEIDVKNRDFKILKLKENIISLRALLPKNNLALEFFIENSKELDKEIHLKRMNCRKEQRVSNKRDLIKKLKGFRAYDKNDNKLLRPYLNKITNILENNLKLNQLLSPGYSEIYFSISDTLEDAKTEFPLEDWYEYTYCEMDYDKFESLDVINKFNYLSGILSSSLDEICRIDHLDKTTIEELKAKFQNDLKEFLTNGSPEQIEDELKAFSRNEKILLNRK